MPFHGNISSYYEKLACYMESCHHIMLNHLIMELHQGTSIIHQQSYSIMELRQHHSAILSESMLSTSDNSGYVAISSYTPGT